MSTPVRRPERVDVCIIGAGATGATAAKVLTEDGRRVVALEKGPWRTKETLTSRCRPPPGPTRP